MTQETIKLSEDQIIELCDRTNKEIAQKFDENGLKISTDGTRLIRADGKHNSYVIPEGIIAICRKAFNGCKNVNEIILPTSLRYIGEYAFESTSSLKQIIFPNSVEYIGKGAFSYSGLKKVDLSNIKVNVIKKAAAKPTTLIIASCLSLFMRMGFLFMLRSSFSSSVRFSVSRYFFFFM